MINSPDCIYGKGRGNAVIRMASVFTGGVLRLAVLCALFVLLFMPAQAGAAEFKKTKIAVLDFELQGEEFETRDMGKIVAEWLITGLVQAGRFDVIERNLLEKVLKEQELPMYGIVDAKGAARTGQIVGAQVVITGTVMKLHQFMEVSARLINVEDGSIIAAEKVKSESAIKLENLVSQMIDQIIQDFPLEGYIVARGDDNTAAIDIGRRAGARVGKRFLVYKEGKVIKHPKTGQVLDIERVEIGEIEIREVKEKTSTGVIVREVAPHKVMYGQMVRSAFEAVSDHEPHYEAPAPRRAERGKKEEVLSSGEFKVGAEYYLRTALHADKASVSWENTTSDAVIPAGEKVMLTSIARHIVRFTNRGREYTFVYHLGKTPNPVMLSKFFTGEDPNPVISSYPNDIRVYMSRGKAAVGMTKWQVLYAMGVPQGIDKKKTHNLPLDVIMQSNVWVYREGMLDRLFIKFLNDKVVSVKD